MENCGLQFRVTKLADGKYDCLVVTDLGDDTTTDGTEYVGTSARDALNGAFSAAAHLLRGMMTEEEFRAAYDI